MSRHTLAGINLAVTAAVRRVNAAYNRLPEGHRPEAAPYDALDAELDAACAAGDRLRAERAIRDWEAHWLERFRRVAA